MYTFSDPSPLPPDPSAGTAGSPLPSRAIVVTAGSLPPDPATAITRGLAPAVMRAPAALRPARPGLPADRSA